MKKWCLGWSRGEFSEILKTYILYHIRYIRIYSIYRVYERAIYEKLASLKITGSDRSVSARFSARFFGPFFTTENHNRHKQTLFPNTSQIVIPDRKLANSVRGGVPHSASSAERPAWLLAWLPASSIQLPASSVQRPASSVQRPASSASMAISVCLRGSPTHEEMSHGVGVISVGPYSVNVGTPWCMYVDIISVTSFHAGVKYYDTPSVISVGQMKNYKTGIRSPLHYFPTG